ncbi:hypothetical protein GA0070613_4259 [Micromonospora inositola]|uniref:Uncharacterized protein n=1 Tax=Micromonospora inositola TaxID=47865 RepID=A0A1C5JAG8_9ACTN|nr:hypothetical protein GA0070613_4259 [Micromonospora inositola]
MACDGASPGQAAGSAPATVAALQGRTAGTLHKPVGTSIGAHGLTRSLPAGLCDWWPSSDNFGAEISALTHTGGAVDAAALGSTLIRLLGEGRIRLPQRPVNLMADG